MLLRPRHPVLFFDFIGAAAVLPLDSLGSACWSLVGFEYAGGGS